MADFDAYDMVKETTTTTGPGTVTLLGAVTGYRSFSVVGDATKCRYAIQAVDTNGIPTGAWEVGQGTYTVSGTTLSRDVIEASSNSGSVVSFAAGTKNVYLVFPASVMNALKTIVGAAVNFSVSGGVPSIAYSVNVSSVVRNSNNNYTINFTNNEPVLSHYYVLARAYNGTTTAIPSLGVDRNQMGGSVTIDFGSSQGEAVDVDVVIFW